MERENSKLTLGEAAARYLAGLSAEAREESQPELHRFARWFGRERLLSGLSAPEVANYAERLSQSGTDYARKLEMVRAFLACARKAGWSQTNLGVHLKVRRGKSSAPVGGRGPVETVPLTRQGYAELEAELASLKNRRPELIEEIRRAAADKDFRENAPLAAAREQRGHLEGRIQELEATLRAASIVGEEPRSGARVSLGDDVVLCELSSGEELRYQVVTPREVDPIRGKISSASPLGKGLLGKGEGEEVEVTAPAGKIRYRISKIMR